MSHTCITCKFHVLVDVLKLTHLYVLRKTLNFSVRFEKTKNQTKNYNNTEVHITINLVP